MSLALHSCIAKICRDRLTKVVRIAFCGQMHGVMFWKRGKAWKVHTTCRYVIKLIISELDIKCKISMVVNVTITSLQIIEVEDTIPMIEDVTIMRSKKQVLFTLGRMEGKI